MSMEWVLLGCLEETRDTLAHLIHLGEKPDHIVCISREEADRQKITNFVDMQSLSQELSIPCSVVTQYSMNSESDLSLFRKLRPRVLLVVGWQRLVPNTILGQVELGAIGFHGSCNILPWGRGRSPINWSIIEGRNRFALHMFFIKPGVDDGDIIGIKLYDINPWDNCRSVYYKTAIAQAELLAACLPSIRGGECPRMAQHGKEFYYPKRTPRDGRIDWNQDAESICRLVRAVTWPYPGAITEIDGIEVKIWDAQPFSSDFFNNATPGEICFVTGNRMGESVVACRSGSVLLKHVESSAVIRLGNRFQ